jgi:hypothetical protein
MIIFTLNIDVILEKYVDIVYSDGVVNEIQKKHQLQTSKRIFTTSTL